MLIPSSSTPRPLIPTPPIEQFTEEERQAPASSTSGSVMPLAQYIDGTDPNSEAGRVKKQQRRLYEDASTQGALEILAFKRASEKAGIGELRRQFPNSSGAELAVIWRRQLTGEDVDEDGLPVPVLEEAHRKDIERVEHYLRYYNAEHSASIHDSSLHCTFCGKLFPIFYLLPINPKASTTGATFTIGVATSALRARTTIMCGTPSARTCLRQDSAHGATWEIDTTTTPTAMASSTATMTSPGWHIAIEVTHGYYAKVYFDNFWDTSKCRWVRKPVFLRKNGLQTASIGIPDWYQICQKINVIRKELRKEVSKQRSASWKQMCNDIEKERPG